MSGNTPRSEEWEVPDQEHRRAEPANQIAKSAQAPGLVALLKGWLYRRFGAWGLLALFLVLAALTAWWQ